MAALTAPKVNLDVPAHGASWGALTIVLALVISAGGLGWTENANDYSRYLPRRLTRGGSCSPWQLAALCRRLCLRFSVPPSPPVFPPPPPRRTGGRIPRWFVWPYLIFAIVQLFAINTLDLYSSGVTLQSLVPRLRRLQCVAIDTVICGALAAYAVLSSDFYSLLADFLLFIIVWLGPWCAIYLVDSWLRRNRMTTGDF